MANHANVQLNSAGQVVLRSSGTISAAVALGDPGDPCCCNQTNACCTRWFTRFSCSNGAWATPSQTAAGTSSCSGGGTSCASCFAGTNCCAGTSWTVTTACGNLVGCDETIVVQGATQSLSCASLTCTASATPAKPATEPCCCSACVPCNAGCGTNGYRVIINSSDPCISGTYDNTNCSSSIWFMTAVHGNGPQLGCLTTCNNTTATNHAGCYQVDITDSDFNPDCPGTGSANACPYHFIPSSTTGANCTGCFVCPPPGTYVGDPDCNECPGTDSNCSFGTCDFSATATVIKL